MADNLDEALAEGNGEKAVRLYWDLVDQAYGKTAKRHNRKQREERVTELKALASLTPRERLRLELTERWGAMADNLDEALAAGNGEKAVRLYFDLVDQAYGKTAQQLEVKAGPLGDLSEVPTEELMRQVAEMRAQLELPEKTG